MKRSLSFLAVALFSFSFFTGCKGKETTVIQPAAQYEPTEQEKKNDEALKAATAPKSVDPAKPDFGGN